MADSIVVATAESTPADRLAPGCFQEFENLDWSLGHITRFDTNRGAVILTEGSQCWTEIRDWFTDITDWMTKQLKMAEETDIGQADAAKELALDVAEV